MGRGMSLKFGILGLLAEQPLHAYSVKARFEDLLGGSWEVNIGQVYTTIQRLERDRLVEPAEPRGDRGRLPYRLTGRGARPWRPGWPSRSWSPSSSGRRSTSSCCWRPGWPTATCPPCLPASAGPPPAAQGPGRRRGGGQVAGPRRPGPAVPGGPPAHRSRPQVGGRLRAGNRTGRASDDDAGGADRGQQDLRRGRRADRPGQAEPGHRGRRVHGHHGALGKREVHPAQPGRRGRPAERWPGAGWQGRTWAGSAKPAWPASGARDWGSSSSSSTCSAT